MTESNETETTEMYFFASAACEVEVGKTRSTEFVSAMFRTDEYPSEALIKDILTHKYGDRYIRRSCKNVKKCNVMCYARKTKEEYYAYKKPMRERSHTTDTCTIHIIVCDVLRK